MSSVAVQVPPQRLPPATGGEHGERDRVASRLSGLLSWKAPVIGACVVFTIYIAVVPLGFLLWQSFFTPQTASKAAEFTFGNYISPPTPAATLIIELENGFRTYHAGDTAVFGDMALIGQRYKPDLALLPIGGNFTIDPTDAAWAVKNLLKPKAVIPMHYDSNPLTKSTAAQFIAAMGNSTVKVVVAIPGQALSF